MALNLCKLNWTAVSSISFQKRRFTPVRAIYRQPVESLIRGCSFSSKKRFPRGGTQLSNSIRHSIRITSELALVKIISIKFQGNDYQIGVYRVNFGWNLVDSCLKSLTCSTETWSNICTDNFVSFSFFGGLFYLSCRGCLEFKGKKEEFWKIPPILLCVETMKFVGAYCNGFLEAVGPQLKSTESIK